jgi:hypothetical protein
MVMFVPIPATVADAMADTNTDSGPDGPGMRAGTDAVADLSPAADGSDLNVRAHLGHGRPRRKQGERKSGSGKEFHRVGLVSRLMFPT